MDPDTQPKWGMKTIVAGGIVLLAAGFFIGMETRPLVPWASSEQVNQGPESADMTAFYKAWKLLDDNFASATTTVSTSTESHVWGAIQGLASSYGDPYTVFFPPVEKSAFDSQVSGNFEGVGMEVGIKDGQLTVVAPIKGTPAFRAGIQSGDAILKIDGKETAGLAVDEAVGKIRGKGGTTVVLTLSRKGDAPFEVSLVREQIDLPTVDTKLRPDGVFVIQLYTFNAIAPQKFRDALREFADSGSNKLIVDVRGNPGGYLEVAVDLASWFLPVGDVVVTQDYGAKAPADVERSRGYDAFGSSLKLVVLIDGGSASASEIFAGALRDHNRATLIGAKSFGKGSVQQLFDVTNNTSLKITIARWLTPNGISISHQGIEPDIKVEITKEDIAAKNDAQMERAASFLLTGK